MKLMECAVKGDSRMTSRIPSCFFFWSSCSGGSAVMSKGTEASCENYLSVPSWKQIIQSESSHHMAPTLAIISFLKKDVYWLCWAFVVHRLFSSCGEQGPLFVAVCGLLIVVISLVVCTGCRSEGFSRCSSWALQHRLNSCGARAYLPPSNGTFLD